MSTSQDEKQSGKATDANAGANEAGKPDSPRTATGAGTRDDTSGGGAFVFLFYATIGLFYVWNNDEAWNFIVRNAVPVAIVVVAVALVIYFQRERLTGPTHRGVTLIIFIAIPILVLLVWAVAMLPAPYQIVLLRSVFLLIVCLLPATMYYLFITSRKSSLLQEYFTNLSRLGLLGRQGQESRTGARVRVMSYVQKFEAVYGAVPGALAEKVGAAPDMGDIELKDSDFHESSPGSVMGGVFTQETAIPVLLATLLIGLGWLLTLPPWEMITFPEDAPMLDKVKLILEPKGIATCFAFLGAYFFSLQMLFRRYVRKDLRLNAYMAVSLRIILAVIGTWVVLQAVVILSPADSVKASETQAMLVTGFVIGAFPPVAWQVIQAAFQKVTGAKNYVPSLASAMPVSDLDGLTVWHEARLEEEDIENIPNMATADIVELMLNTRVPPNRIVDWVDQAILYTQLGMEKEPENKDEKSPSVETYRKRLREHGIRTASSLVAAYLSSATHNDVELFEKILPGEGRSRVRSLVDTLMNNPTLGLIQKWQRQTVTAQS